MRPAITPIPDANAQIPPTEPVEHRVRYYVVGRDESWFIRFEDDEYGPYKSRSEAMLFAIDAAQNLGVKGEQAEVLLVGENDHARLEWQYGRDPYPPKL